MHNDWNSLRKNIKVQTSVEMMPMSLTKYTANVYNIYATRLGL